MQITIYLAIIEYRGTKMRISLADSLRRGFKKWSDAQDATPLPAAVDPIAESAERRRTAVTAADKVRVDDIG